MVDDVLVRHKNLFDKSEDSFAYFAFGLFPGKFGYGK